MRILQKISETFIIVTASLAGLCLLIHLINPGNAEPQPMKPDRSTYTAVIPRYLPPTYFLDKQTGKADGFAVEIMDRIAEQAGIHIDYIFADSWTDVINTMMSGKADMIPDIGITEERRKALLFTAPLEVFTVSLYTRSHSTIRALTAGTEVGVIKGSIAHEYLGTNTPPVHLVLYDNYGQLLIDLFAGRIDVLAGPEPTILRSAQEMDIEDKIKMIGEPLAEIKRGIAVRPDDPQLRTRLDTVVRGFIEQPEYRRIYQKWYGKPRPYWNTDRIAAAASILIIAIVVIMSAWRYSTVLRLNSELQRALDTIKTLHGILPICSSCKKIRDDKGAWQHLEKYISQHTDAEFSHGMCSECAKKLYPQYFKEKGPASGE